MQRDTPSFRLRAEQSASMATNGVAGAASGLFGALAVAGALVWLEPADPAQVGLWIGAMAAAYAVHVWLCLRRRRSPSPGIAPFVGVAAAEGIIWGLGIVWFCATGPLEQELVVVLIAGGIAGAVGLSFGSTMPAYFARFLPATLPYVLWSATTGHGHAALHRVLSACVLAFVAGNVQLARGFNAGFMAVHLARFANADLADSLRVQKDAAEAATLAKSRFLAAASHDLRQPIHALGLFVSALEGAGLATEARRLVQHIGASVTALDSLFGALMDISRLDAGVVRPSMGAVALQPLLARLCLDHAAEAAGKHIALRLHPTSAIVTTDSVLLERILRNLISNAVRYTDAGRVVVLCRKRGASVSVQIWDSGRGIPAEEQARVFDEFHQIDRPDRERGPGLGLGLSIVRRLSLLLGTEVTLQSRPGRGSRFALALPLASRSAAEIPSPLPPPVAGRILVIDDTPAITASMATLLSGWGHQVSTAGSYGEAVARAGVPDLIICDYHLAGATGPDTVARLRGDIGHAVPAMLITADTSARVAARARQEGLLLLHKPVSSARLRAAIGRMIGPRSGMAGQGPPGEAERG